MYPFLPFLLEDLPACLSLGLQKMQRILDIVSGDSAAELCADRAMVAVTLNALESSTHLKMFLQRIQGELFLFMDLCGNIIGALGL